MINGIGNHKLIELGDSSLTLNGIVKLLLVMTLVVVLERLFPSFLRRVLFEVAATNPSVLKEPPPMVRFLAFGDRSLNLELAVWILDMACSPTRFRSGLFICH